MYRIETYIHTIVGENHIKERENIYATPDYTDALTRFTFETDYQYKRANLAIASGSERGFIYVIWYDIDGSILDRVNYTI